MISEVKQQFEFFSRTVELQKSTNNYKYLKIHNETICNVHMCVSDSNYTYIFMFQKVLVDCVGNVEI